METSLWKLSAGLGPSFLETGWLARQFPRNTRAFGNSALDLVPVSWKPAGWLRRCGFQHKQSYCTTIAKNIPNIFNLITRRSERLQKRRAGGRRPPAAQLSLWLQWGHRTKRIDMHRTRTGHHDGNRRRTTTTQPQTSSRAVTRAVTHATYISSMRAVNSTMRLRNTRPTAGTAVLPAGERTPHAPRSSASHR